MLTDAGPVAFAAGTDLDAAVAALRSGRRLVRRVAGYTLAGLSACALMITTADATGRVAGAKVRPRTSAQKHSKAGAGRAESARWRTGPRRPCGRRCR